MLFIVRRMSTVLGRRTLVEVDVGKIIRKQNGVELFEDYWTDSDSEDAETSNVHPTEDVDQVLFQDVDEVAASISEDQPSPVKNFRKRTKQATHNKSKKTRKTVTGGSVSQNYSDDDLTEALNNVDSGKPGAIMDTNSDVDGTNSKYNEKVGEASEQHSCSDAGLTEANGGTAPNLPIVEVFEETDEDIVAPSNQIISDTVELAKTSDRDLNENQSEGTTSDDDVCLNTDSEVNNDDMPDKCDGVQRTNKAVNTQISKIPKRVLTKKESNDAKITGTLNEVPPSPRRYQTRSVCTEEFQSTNQVVKTVMLPNSKIDAQNSRKKQKVIAQEVISSDMYNADENSNVGTDDKTDHKEHRTNEAISVEECYETEDILENNDSSPQHEQQADSSEPATNDVEMESDKVHNSSDIDKKYGLTEANGGTAPNLPIVEVFEETDEDIVPPSNQIISDTVELAKTSDRDLNENQSEGTTSDDDVCLNTDSEVNNDDMPDKCDGVQRTNKAVNTQISKIPKRVLTKKESNDAKITGTLNEVPPSPRRYQTRSVCTEEFQSTNQVVKTVMLPNSKIDAQNSRKKQKVIAQEVISSDMYNADENSNVGTDDKTDHKEHRTNEAISVEECYETEDILENNDSSPQHEQQADSSEPTTNDVEMESDKVHNSSDIDKKYGKKRDRAALLRSPVSSKRLSSEGTCLENSDGTMTSKAVLLSHEAENPAVRCSPQGDVDKIINAKNAIVPRRTARKSIVRRQNVLPKEVRAPVENDSQAIQTAVVQNEISRSVRKATKKVSKICSHQGVNETVAPQQTSEKSVVVHHVTHATRQSSLKDGNEINNEILHEQYVGERRTEAWTDSGTLMRTTETVTYRTVCRSTESHKGGRKNLEKTAVDEENSENVAVDEENSENVVRRSNRQRFRPLESWRNERALYRINDGTYEFVGIDKGGKDDSEWNHTLEKKKGPQLKKVKKEKKTCAVTVVDPETEEEISAKLITPYESLSWIGPGGSSKESSSVLVTKSYQFDDYSCGLIKIKPYKEKSLQYLPEHDLVFFVVEGDIRVRIHTSQIVLHSKDTFIVPQGSPYLLSNISNKPALVHFSMLRKSYLNHLKV